MPGHARQMPSPRPAAIAVHNDCDVFWEPRWIKLPVSFRFFAIQPGRNRRLQRNLFRLLKLTHSLGERNDAKVTGVSGGTGPVFAEALSQSKVKSEGLTANNETRRGGRPRPPTNLAQSEQLKTLTNLAIVRRAPLARVAKRGQSECHYPWMHAQSGMSPLSAAQAASSLALMRPRCAGASARFCRIAERSSCTWATWRSWTVVAWHVFVVG